MIDGRAHNGEVAVKKEKGEIYQWLLEEQEARKRHTGPYPYQSAGEIDFCMNRWKFGLSGRG